MNAHPSKLRIQHSTTYVYREPVSFGAHRLMLRPRESRDLRLIAHEVMTEPSSELAWSQDVFGNTVGIARFHAAVDRLTLTSASQVTITSSAWPVFDIAASALTFPFLYEKEEWVDLGGLRLQQYLDDGRLTAWARGFVMGDGTDTLSLLQDLSNGVAANVAYQSREVGGAQTPLQTLELSTGSCRDMALLFVEAVRSLGFGARIVSATCSIPTGRAWAVQATDRPTPGRRSTCLGPAG